MILQKLFKKLFLVSIVSLFFILTACSSGEETSNASNENSEKGTDSGNNEELASFEVSISNFMPDSHVLNQKVMIPLAESIKEGTQGRIDATVYSGGALGKAQEHFNMAKTGVADVSIVIHGYTPGKFPATEVGELPFIVPYENSSAEAITNVLWQLKEKYPAIEKDHEGTKILALFTADPAVFILKEKINSLDDLAGLKIRTPSTAANGILEALGATPVSMPMPAVYDALQKGVIDGAFGVMSALKQFKLDEVSKYVINTKVYGTTFALVMNNSVYEKFKGKDKELLDSLTGKELSLTAAKGMDEEAVEAAEIAKEKGIEIRDLTPEEIEYLNKAVQPVIENWIKKVEDLGIPGKQMYEDAVKLGQKTN